MATLAKARELGAQLRTPMQAQEAIRLALATLRKAADAVDNFPITDSAAGIVKAYASRIGQQITRISTLQKRLDGPYDRKLADAVALAVLQSADVLQALRRDVSLSAASSTVQALAEDFARALRQILEGVATAAAHAIPWWGWALLAYVILRDDERR